MPKIEETCIKKFRHSSFRPGQEDALLRIARGLDQELNTVIAELPTGIGKSDIAMALAQSAGHVYITTPQNILIDQYLKDFSSVDGFYHIKGKSQYPCHSFESCKEGSQSKCSSWKGYSGSGESSCAYKKAKERAQDSDIVLTNSKYYALGIPHWDQVRDLTVIDEAHNLANDILSLIEFTVTDKYLERLRLSVTIPDYPKQEVDLKELSRFVTRLESHLRGLLHQIKEEDLPVGGEDVEKIEDLHKRLKWFLTSVDLGVRWIADYTRDKWGKRVIARPLDTAFFAKSLFFSHSRQYVLQSATIVDHKRYVAELGLKGGIYIRKPSPFSTQSRSVYPLNVGKLSKDHLESNLPKVAKTIEMLMVKHQDEKGIIHTGSYKIQKYLSEVLGSSRLLFPTPGDRAASISEHIASKKPTVLVSPSMTEGLDLKGDLARFSIVVKVPYPDMGDRRIRLLMQDDPGWYQYQTAKTFLQAWGRGVRSESDYCKTYVLDSGFGYFVKKAGIESYLNGCIVR